MDLQNIIKAERRKFQILNIILIVILSMTIIISISLGKAGISIITTSKVIIGKLFSFSGLYADIPEYQIAIIWDVRMPRILTGAIVGAGLAVSGVVFQAILRNPLADPYTIGVSTGAAFGAVLAIYLNIFFLSNPILVMPSAFLFAVLTLVTIIKIAQKKEMIHSTNLILAGIIVSSILSSGISFIKSMSGEEVSAIVFWLMGSLSARSWQQVLLCFPIVMICIILCSHYAEDLDILTLGEIEAKNLGINASRMMKFYLISAALITAVCVSVSGIIGFVGLVVPHMLRMGFTTKHKYLIPLSAVTGAILLTGADNLSRLLLHVEIPVGVVTTLLGGPFFIYLFVKQNNQ